MPDNIRHGLFCVLRYMKQTNVSEQQDGWAAQKYFPFPKANGIQERQKTACNGDGNEKDMHDTGDDGAASPDKHLCAQ